MAGKWKRRKGNWNKIQKQMDSTWSYLVLLDQILICSNDLSPVKSKAKHLLILTDWLREDLGSSQEHCSVMTGTQHGTARRTSVSLFQHFRQRRGRRGSAHCGRGLSGSQTLNAPELFPFRPLVITTLGNFLLQPDNGSEYRPNRIWYGLRGGGGFKIVPTYELVSSRH